MKKNETQKALEKLFYEDLSIEKALRQLLEESKYVGWAIEEKPNSYETLMRKASKL